MLAGSSNLNGSSNLLLFSGRPQPSEIKASLSSPLIYSSFFFRLLLKKWRNKKLKAEKGNLQGKRQVSTGQREERAAGAADEQPRCCRL